MKELSIEEKAKRYDEALHNAKAWYNTFVNTKKDENMKQLIEEIFSELKEEREDERIRKWLIYYFKEVCDNVSEKEKKGVIAWLEKQDGKDKFIEKELECIKGYRENAIKRLEELEKQGEQKSTAWSEEDEMRFNNIFTLLEELPLSQNWFKSLKDRVQPHPQSYERNRLLVQLEEWLDEYVSDLTDVDTSTLICSFTNYLDNKLPKSLKPKSQWKPSDEQIKVCKEVYADILSAKGFDFGTVNSELNRLEEELKKLKG